MQILLILQVIGATVVDQWQAHCCSFVPCTVSSVFILLATNLYFFRDGISTASNEASDELASRRHIKLVMALSDDEPFGSM